MVSFLKLFFLNLLVIFSTQGAGVDPQEVLKRADQIRNPSNSYSMLVQVKSSDSDQVSEFEVLVKGNSRTLVKTLEPKRDRGRNLLMLDENMWAYIPNIKRAVRVSLAQKLSGQAANGDISRMRWSGDYDAKMEESTEGDRYWQLYLTAKKKGLTYEKIRIWVEKSNFRPFKAEYLSLNDKVLKKSWFKSYRKIAGEVRPTEVYIQDGVRKDQASTILIKKMEPQNFPNSLFHQRNLK